MKILVKIGDAYFNPERLIALKVDHEKTPPGVISPNYRIVAFLEGGMALAGPPMGKDEAEQKALDMATTISRQMNT